MKSKSLILLILSIGFGIVAAIGILQVLKNTAGADQPSTPRGPVVLATDAVDIRTVLTGDNVKIENWPLDIIPPDAVTSIDEITDMVTLSRLSKGMPIVKGAIQHKNIVDRTPIPEGMKVVAVRVSADNMIGDLLQPGNKVDVIGVFKKRDKRSGFNTSTSRTFLKALKVYSIGNQTTARTKEKAGSSSGTSIVGLIVNQKQSEALVFVQDTGSIKLVLRGDDDENDGSVGDLGDIEEELLADDSKASEPLKDMGNLKIWKGPTITTTEFGQDGAPKDTMSNGSDRGGSSNRGDSGGREDDDRGIDDDQYRGE